DQLVAQLHGRLGAVVAPELLDIHVNVRHHGLLPDVWRARPAWPPSLSRRQAPVWAAPAGRGREREWRTAPGEEGGWEKGEGAASSPPRRPGGPRPLPRWAGPPPDHP